MADALELAQKILDSLLIQDKWTIVNILIDDRDAILIKNYHLIPPSFGYKYVSTITLLEENGVVEGKTNNWWYVGSVKSNSYIWNTFPQEIQLDDHISEVARKKGYINKDESVRYYYDVSKGDVGPQLHEQYAILVNREKLEDFINYFKELKPRFNLDTGILEFMGESVQIDGKINRKSFNLLFDNLNSIVTKKEFYEVREKQDYDIIYKQPGITKLHDVLKKVFLELKEKVESYPKLKHAIKFVQKDGFGIFIDEKALTEVINKPNSPKLL